MKLIYCLVAALAIVGCSKKEDPIVTAPVAEKPPEKVISVDEKLSAMIRGHRAIKVCYDSAENAFFLYYTEPAASPEDFTGWYWINKIEFYSAANNIPFIAAMSTERYITVFPDVTGLPCKVKQ